MSRPLHENNAKLVHKIERLRKEMIRTGITEGLSSKKTIALSQRLDYYVMKYQQQNNKVFF